MNNITCKQRICTVCEVVCSVMQIFNDSDMIYAVVYDMIFIKGGSLYDKNCCC